MDKTKRHAVNSVLSTALDAFVFMRYHPAGLTRTRPAIRTHIPDVYTAGTCLCVCFLVRR